MVEGAVPSELVSKLDFPVRGENTGNWSILRPTSLLSTAKDVRFSAGIRSQFPNPQKRESRGAYQGNKFEKAGNLRSQSGKDPRRRSRSGAADGFRWR